MFEWRSENYRSVFSCLTLKKRKSITCTNACSDINPNRYNRIEYFIVTVHGTVRLRFCFLVRTEMNEVGAKKVASPSGNEGMKR